VARALACWDSKVSRIETGHVGATPGDVRDILDLCGVGGEQRDALVQVATEARQKGWWQACGDTLVVPLVGLEADAATIRTYELACVPGLLQTADYARAVIRAGRPDLHPKQVERWVEFRMARQALLRGDELPATASPRPQSPTSGSKSCWSASANTHRHRRCVHRLLLSLPQSPRPAAAALVSSRDGHGG
jgi:hypothetical protein